MDIVEKVANKKLHIQAVLDLTHALHTAALKAAEQDPDSFIEGNNLHEMTLSLLDKHPEEVVAKYIKTVIEAIERGDS